MRKLHLRYVVPMVMLAFLSACGFNTPPPKPTIQLPEPRPRTVSATQDAARTVSKLIPLTGGVLEATGEDGTVYRLTIPGTALLAPTTVSITPLVSLEGAPVTGSLHGVALEPARLRLYDAATLEITPASGDAISAIGFAAHSDGSEFHLAPPARTGGAGSVMLHLFHFSLHGTYLGTEVAPYTIQDSVSDFMPSDWEGWLEQLLSDLLAQERTAELLGEEGDPELAEKLEAILNTIFERRVAPLLPGIAGSCAGMEANGSKALGWVRTTQLVGMGATFAPEAARVESAARAGAHRCWEEAIEPCIDPAAASYARVLQAARLNLLLGGSSAVYDPAREELQCENECAWVADLTAVELEFSFDLQMAGAVLGDSGSSGELGRKWTARALLPSFDAGLGGPATGVVPFRTSLGAGDVSYVVDSTVTSSDGRVLYSTQGSGNVPTNYAHLDSFVQVNLSDTCLMSGTFVLVAPGIEVRESGRVEERDLQVSAVYLWRQPLTPGATRGVATAAGRSDQPPGLDPYADFSAGIDPVLSAFRNRGIWGEAQVQWTITMITEP